jgi:hypothetical protein
MSLWSSEHSMSSSLSLKELILYKYELDSI